MSDEEARQLPVTVDAATLRSFGSSTWTTDAGHGVVMHLAALDDIVASKEFADRVKDREALPELRQLQQRRPRA